jgi:beta-lactam-binding protein with PASTA domain
MYYQQSSAKVFWISFLTSLIVSILIGFIFVYLIPQFSSGKANMVEVPDIENLELHQAEMIMDEQGLKIMVEDERFDPTTKKDRVIYQKPTAGETVERGSTVRVVLSKGQGEDTKEEGQIVVPSVIGFDLNQAKVYLSERGLSVGVIEKEESEQAKDVVLRTIPEPGRKVTENFPVKLIVSAGGGKVSVPSLKGKSEYRARTLLEESGLQLGRVNATTNAEYSFDIIIYQSPAPGTMVEKGSKVDITVNREGS